MTHDEVIEAAAFILWQATAPRSKTNYRSAKFWQMLPNPEKELLRSAARAVAPLLMEHGARLMQEAAFDEVEGGFGSYGVHNLDPATIVREAKRWGLVSAATACEAL
jgi:hypothetical protein